MILILFLIWWDPNLEWISMGLSGWCGQYESPENDWLLTWVATADGLVGKSKLIRKTPGHLGHMSSLSMTGDVEVAWTAKSNVLRCYLGVPEVGAMFAGGCSVAHRCALVLRGWRSVCRVRERQQHLRAEPQLQLSARLPPGHGLQDPQRLQPQGLQQPALCSAARPVRSPWLWSRLWINQDVHYPHEFCEGRECLVSGYKIENEKKNKMQKCFWVGRAVYSQRAVCFLEFWQ